MTTPNVPRIETERLVLRAHRREDFEHCAAMWGDPAVTRYIGGTPLTREEVWARTLRYVGHWSWMGFGHWAIEEKATGDFLGEVGFADFKRNIEPPVDGTPEIGWVVVPRAHGKGIGTEAVRAAVAWGEGKFGGIPTICLIHPENLASLRLAEKCGYQRLLRTVYKEQPTIIFTRR